VYTLSSYNPCGCRRGLQGTEGELALLLPGTLALEAAKSSQTKSWSQSFVEKAHSLIKDLKQRFNSSSDKVSKRRLKAAERWNRGWFVLEQR